MADSSPTRYIMRLFETSGTVWQKGMPLPFLVPSTGESSPFPFFIDTILDRDDEGFYEVVCFAAPMPEDMYVRMRLQMEQEGMPKGKVEEMVKAQRARDLQVYGEMKQKGLSTQIHEDHVLRAEWIHEAADLREYLVEQAKPRPVEETTGDDLSGTDPS